MTQLSSSASTCEARWKMWHLRVFAVIYLTAVCASQAIAAATTETILEEPVTLPPTVYVPPDPVLELKSALNDVFTTEKVELSCKITDSSDWIFTWQMNGQSLSSSPDVSIPGDGSELTIPSVTAKHAGTYSCSGRHKIKGVVTKSSNSIQIKVAEPPIPALVLMTPWADVFLYETVEYSCRVSSNEWTATWYKDSNGLGKEGPTLSISSASEADQGVYTCKAQLKSRGVFSGPSTGSELRVHANKPSLTVTQSPNFDKMFPKENITLTCDVSVQSEWEYVWYHRGAEIQVLSSNPYRILSIAHSNSGEYYCKARRKGKSLFYTDASTIIVLQVSDPPTPTLRLVTPWSDVFENELLEFHCTVNSADWTVVWFQDQHDLANEHPSLSISAVTKANKGQYACKAQHKSRGVISGLSNTVDITVHATKPKPKLSRSSDFDKMYPGENITFTCTVDESSGWEYVWYHKEGEIHSSSSKMYSIYSIVHSNSGDYHCKAKRGSFYTDQSDTTSLQVSDPPTPTLKLLSPWSDVFQNEDLAFSCEVSSSDWTFTWYRNDISLQMDSQVKLNEKGSLLNITSVTQGHQGRYACKAQLQSRGVISGLSKTVDVTVYATKPKPELSRSSDFDKMYPGENITFMCTVDESSGWEYVWYHKEGEIHSSSSKMYSIYSIVHSNSGDYHCKAKRGSFYTDQSDTTSLQVSDPPTPTLKLLSPWSDVFQNEDVAFSCEVSSSDWTFTWYRNDISLQKDSQVKVNEKRSLLNITSVTQGHQGRYACKAQLQSRGVISGFSNRSDISVYEHIPTPKLSRNPKFSPMYVGETVQFTCGVDVSSGWKYQWYKGGNELSESGKALSINLAVSHKGEYSCKASRGQKTSTRRSDNVTLDVQEIPVPSLKEVTRWLDVFPTERVELSCGMEGSSGWTYTWFNNKSRIKADNAIHIENEGGKLSISAASTTHRGNYSCSGELKGRSVSSSSSSEVQLHVYDTKPRVLLVQSPEYSLMHTSDSVFFGCHVNVSSGWSYLWYKDDQLLEAASAQHYNISSVTDKNTGAYKCQVKRGVNFKSDKSEAVKLTIEERPKAGIVLLTGWSDVFSTDSLLLECNVKDSQISWNYTWFKEKEPVRLPPSEDHQQHEVTPQNDPEQSLYTCMGIRDGRPSYSVVSDSYRTKNLLLKRRILLAISGCLFFGIIAVFIGCIALRILRKPDSAAERSEEANLFLTMAQLKDRTDAPCPLVEYITDADLNAPPKEGEENGIICSETTPLPIDSQENQAVTTSSHDATENGSGMTSFQH